MFQDGSLHLSSDSCHSLFGDIGFTSEIGGVNQWGPKWKHNRAIKGLYSKRNRLRTWNQILLQRPTMFTMWHSVHYLLFVKASICHPFAPQHPFYLCCEILLNLYPGLTIIPIHARKYRVSMLCHQENIPSHQYGDIIFQIF